MMSAGLNRVARRLCTSTAILLLALCVMLSQASSPLPGLASPAWADGDEPREDDHDEDQNDDGDDDEGDDEDAGDEEDDEGEDDEGEDDEDEDDEGEDDEGEDDEGEDHEEGEDEDDDEADDRDDEADGAEAGMSDQSSEDGEEDRSRYASQEVIVASSDVGFLQSVQGLGYRVLDVERFDRLGLDVVRLRTPAGTSALEARNDLQARFPELTLDVNGLYDLQQSATLLAPRAAYTMIDWPEPCSAGVTIGLIDTGVDAAALRPGTPVVQSPGAVAGDHGTAVASLIVGAPAADVPALVADARLAVAAIVSGAQGNSVSAINLIGGLDWLAANRAAVITISLAGDPSRVVDLALDSLAADGVTLVAAVGNAGPAAPPRAPASHPAVIAVTAVDAEGIAYPAAGRGAHVDLAAPGVGLRTASVGGDAAIRDGTSFAAPIVTAAAAVLVANGAGSAAARADLVGNTRDLGAPGVDPIYGQGLVQRPPGC
jgi:hypothetical protein